MELGCNHDRALGGYAFDMDVTAYALLVDDILVDDSTSPSGGVLRYMTIRGHHDVHCRYVRARQDSLCVLYSGSVKDYAP